MHFFIVFLLQVFVSNSQAQQAENVVESIHWEVNVEEVKIFKDQGIPFLKWDHETLQMESAAFMNYLRLQGKFIEKVIQADVDTTPIEVNPDGSFNLNYAFQMEKSTFVITVIDEKKKVYRMKYRITSKNQTEKKAVLTQFWRFSAGTGITLLSYRQQRVTPFSEFALTVKGGVNYRFIGNIDLGLSAFYNVLPLSTNSPLGYKMQYLGVNTRLGYNLLGAPSPLRININAGLYYNTSISPIGFGNMIGPQLYPEFIYVFNNGNSLLLYLKFSPALSQDTVLSFSDNREIAIGSHYSFPITAKNRMSVGVDISQLKVSVPPNWGITNTYSLSAGISF